MTLPVTVREIGSDAFKDCCNLRVLLTEDGRQIDINGSAGSSLKAAKEVE